MQVPEWVEAYVAEVGLERAMVGLRRSRDARAFRQQSPTERMRNRPGGGSSTGCYSAPVLSPQVQWYDGLLAALGARLES